MSEPTELDELDVLKLENLALRKQLLEQGLADLQKQNLSLGETLKEKYKLREQDQLDLATRKIVRSTSCDRTPA